MDIEIEFQSGIPIYKQIAYQILELIEKGALMPGDQLPTIRKLAVQLGVNFNTVARAYRMLDQVSIISTQHGRGTFILDPREQLQVKKAEPDTIEDLTRFYIRKAAYLGFKPEEIRECFDRIAQEGDQD
jgi:GntR family transcriptional regulator